MNAGRAGLIKPRPREVPICSHDDDAVRPDEAEGGDPPEGHTPVSDRSRPRPGTLILRERAVQGAAWPVAPDERERLEVTRNLEQVGCILRRLELDEADIVRLRTETRAILAGLAA